MVAVKSNKKDEHLFPKNIDPAENPAVILEKQKQFYSELRLLSHFSHENVIFICFFYSLCAFFSRIYTFLHFLFALWQIMSLEDIFAPKDFESFQDCAFTIPKMEMDLDTLVHKCNNKLEDLQIKYIVFQILRFLFSLLSTLNLKIWKNNQKSKSGDWSNCILLESCTEIWTSEMFWLIKKAMLNLLVMESQSISFSFSSNPFFFELFLTFFHFKKKPTTWFFLHFCCYKKNLTKCTSLLMQSIVSIPYKSPEVLFGAEIDASNDIWAVGCILAQMYHKTVSFLKFFYSPNFLQKNWSFLPFMKIFSKFSVQILFPTCGAFLSVRFFFFLEKYSKIFIK